MHICLILCLLQMLDCLPRSLDLNVAMSLGYQEVLKDFPEKLWYKANSGCKSGIKPVVETGIMFTPFHRINVQIFHFDTF